VGDVQLLHAELALLAALFVLPGRGPDVDQAIKLACELLACELDTPATAGVAAMRYGTALRDAGPLLREMLDEQGFPAPAPGDGQDREFRAVLRALAMGSLAVGEFCLIMFDHLPAWDEQDELDRRLMALLDDWEQQATPEARSAAAEALRAAAREAISKAG
jgi:hypothetical protein